VIRGTSLAYTGRVFRQGLRLGFTDFRAFWGWKTWLFCWMLRITTQASAWVLLGSLLVSPDRVQFLMVGNAVAAGVVAIGFTVAASTWDRFDGTYPLMVIAPSSLIPVTLGRTGIWLLNAIASVLATFAFFALVFRWQAPLGALLLLPIFVTVICASSFGLASFLGVLVTKFQLWRNIVHNAMATFTMAFCGVNVPMDFWPAWVRFAAGLVPVTHGLHALRLLLQQGPAGAIGRELALEALVGLAWFALAALTMDRFANAGRADGSIEFT
jgi:ABC-2 type transport system permease protein